MLNNVFNGFWKYRNDSNKIKISCEEVENRNESVISDSNNNKSKASQEVEWGDVKELNNDSLSVMPIDRNILPACFQDYVFIEAKKLNNANPDYLAISLIISAASLIGGTSSIRPKEFDKGWSIRPVLWGLGVRG
jgi:hypothetical protein